MWDFSTNLSFIYCMFLKTNAKSLEKPYCGLLHINARSQLFEFLTLLSLLVFEGSRSLLSLMSLMMLLKLLVMVLVLSAQKHKN